MTARHRDAGGRRRAAAGLVGAGVAVYLAVLAALWWGQERLLFHPTPLPASTAIDRGADVHEVWIDVPGARLHALHLRLPNPRGLVFFLHGNAGNVRSWFGDGDYYRRVGYDLFLLDYRGYGKSGGRIESQDQLLDDVRAAWDAVAPGYAGRDRVIYGRSLGTGPAAILAAEVQPDLTILVSPYASLSALAREHYPWVPGALLRYPLDTAAALERVATPVLLVHGGADTLIPPSHARALLKRSPTARLLVVDDAGHDNVHRHAEYLDGVTAALLGERPGGPAASSSRPRQQPSAPAPR